MKKNNKIIFVNLLLIAIIISLSVFYIIQINRDTRDNFSLSAIDKELNNLKEQNKDLAIELASLCSFERISQFGMEEITQAQYLVIPSTAMAQAR